MDVGQSEEIRYHVKLKVRDSHPTRRKRRKSRVWGVVLRQGGKKDTHHPPPAAGVGPGLLFYLHSSMNTNWPDLYLNMITMT